MSKVQVAIEARNREVFIDTNLDLHHDSELMQSARDLVADLETVYGVEKIKTTRYSIDLRVARLFDLGEVVEEVVEAVEFHLKEKLERMGVELVITEDVHA